MIQITFIHAADLHLDSPFKGMEGEVPSSLFARMKESTFRSFERVVDCAIRERVDFVVLSGDLYDGETRSLRAQMFVQAQMKRLYNYHIPVYMIHGNHDHLGGNWSAIQFPNNVHIFQEPYVERKPFDKNGQLAAYIYGFSYHERAVGENMTAQYKRDKEAPFHIGLLHGSLEGENEHSRYAPFLLSELLDKQFDYWALGHIHKRSILSEHPPIIYPGNIQGRHRKETGEKGCYVVSLSTGISSYKFVPTADLIWEEASVSIEGLQTADELIARCCDVKEQIRREDQGVLLILTFTDWGPLASLLEDERNEDDLIAVLNEGEEAKNAVYIVASYNRTLLTGVWEEHPFISDLLEEAKTFTEMDDVLQPLTSSAAMRSVLEPFLEEEKRDIQQEAERLLIQQLMKGRER